MDNKGGEHVQKQTSRINHSGISSVSFFLWRSLARVALTGVWLLDADTASVLAGALIVKKAFPAKTHKGNRAVSLVDTDGEEAASFVWGKKRESLRAVSIWTL